MACITPVPNLVQIGSHLNKILLEYNGRKYQPLICFCQIKKDAIARQLIVTGSSRKIRFLRSIPLLKKEIIASDPITIPAIRPLSFVKNKAVSDKVAKRNCS